MKKLFSLLLIVPISPLLLLSCPTQDSAIEATPGTSGRVVLLSHQAFETGKDRERSNIDVYCDQVEKNILYVITTPKGVAVTFGFHNVKCATLEAK